MPQFPPHPTPDDLRRAFAATTAEGSARVRVELRRSELPVPAHVGPVRRRLVRAVSGRLAKPQVAEGVLDFDGRRCALVYGGAYAVLVADGSEWSGLPGKELDRLPPPEPAHEDRQPLWLFDLGPSIRAVLDSGPAEAGGTRAAVDAGRDGALTVWVEATGRLRRIEHRTAARALAVDVLELGVELPGDWSRLPG